MLIYCNNHSLQGIKVAKEYFSNTVFCDSIVDVPKNDSESTYLFIGFIYKEQDFSYFNNKQVYWVSNFYAPPKFKQSDITKDYLYQLIELGLVKNTLENKTLSTRYENYFNFLGYDNEFHNEMVKGNTTISYLDELKDKCYNFSVKGINTYLIYENNSILKPLIAHHFLKDTKGIVVISSQTKGKNDLITFYCSKDYKDLLQQTFKEDFLPNTNVMSIFIISYINILGNKLKEFMEV